MGNYAQIVIECKHCNNTTAHNVAGICVSLSAKEDNNPRGHRHYSSIYTYYIHIGKDLGAASMYGMPATQFGRRYRTSS
jgi:hypothetical protein